MNDATMKTDQEKMKILNEAIAAFGFPSLSEMSSETPEIDAEMREALAKAYAMKGFRRWLERQLVKNYIAAAERTETMVDQWFGKARVLTLKELLAASKENFFDYQKIQDAMKREKQDAERSAAEQ